MADGLLSGLGQLGLGNLEKMQIFEEAPKKDEGEAAPKVHVVTEEELIFGKKCDCPICSNKFETKTVRTGKVKLVGSDMDLRPKYDGIEMLKYDVIMCPKCGYTALTRYFNSVGQVQSKKIVETISANFIRRTETPGAISYEEALERYKMALANAIVKGAKASEKAYVCLKSGWLLRSWGESLDAGEANYAEQKATLEKQENEFLSNAYEGFVSARQTEGFPMCGMDETTIDFLICMLAMRFNRFDVASRLIGQIITSPTANNRMKDKAREAKDILLQKLKEKKDPS